MTAVALPRPTLEQPGVSLRALAGAQLLAVAAAVGSGWEGGVPHRLVAAVALPPLAALGLTAVLVRPALRGPVGATLALFGAAALVRPAPLHLALALGALAASAATLVATFAGEPLPAGAVRDYVTLTKPRIMSLLLVTGVCGTFVGARGRPGTATLVAATLGLALACGGASALNHVLDADIDQLMGPRTAARPVASGRLTPARGLEFGLALSAASFALLAATTNVLTAVLALAGNVFYVAVYTGYLKRRGPGNIVLGGAAGAVPPLVGYAAATGHLGWAALWLFAIVFVWTPPHFWALALLIRDHYAAADVPMLPVVRGDRATARRIVGYTVALVAVTVLPFALGSFGLVYLVGAIVLGGIFLAMAIRLARRTERRQAALVFHYSLLYLAALFVAAAVDAVL
ncbi:MAG TPA: heme o synthase [Gaiellaceae bacterium]|nr:heme o synthase [Gaiellaceae bacterium]